MKNTLTTCSVCRRERHSSELIEFDDNLVCAGCKDSYIQCIREGIPVMTLPKNVWRDDMQLIAPLDGDLILERCCYCGQPARKTTSIHVTSKNSRFRSVGKKRAGICKRHRWQLLIGTAGGGVIGGSTSMVILELIGGMQSWTVILLYVLLVTFFMLLYRYFLRLPRVRAKQAGDSDDWDVAVIAGLNEEYLQLFPGS